MNAAEIKLDLFRRLDKLDKNRLEKVYEKILSVINSETSNKQALSVEVKTALDEALNSSNSGKVFSHEEAMQRTKEKFPNLFS